MNLKLFKSRVRNYLYYKRRAKIFNVSKGEKRILYFGIPMHPNLGDQAQKYCIRNWLRENYPNYEVLEIPTRIVVDERFHFLPKLIKNVKASDIIVFQSGYCTHDLAPSTEDLMHRIVIEHFPNNLMLMLPQTVYFQNSERKKLSSNIYSQAKKMLFLARDSVSYGTAREMFPTIPVKLYPDIVTTLIGLKSFNRSRAGIFLCIRHDCEKYYSDEEIDRLELKLSKIMKVTRGDTTINCDPYWLDKHLEHKLDEVLFEYASYKLVITDRYHGTIFSIIAGTPVIVVKTQDHKVSTGVDWFKDIYDFVYFANSLDEVYRMANEILNNCKRTNPEPYFKQKYYDKLRRVFDEVTEYDRNM